LLKILAQQRPAHQQDCCPELVAATRKKLLLLFLENRLPVYGAPAASAHGSWLHSTPHRERKSDQQNTMECFEGKEGQRQDVKFIFSKSKK
jgi:hypothetical protein